MDFSARENLELVRNIFATKDVPLSFLARIKDQREFHRPDWDSVKASSNNPDLAEFDDYFDFVTAKVSLMKALWDE